MKAERRIPLAVPLVVALTMLGPRADELKVTTFSDGVGLVFKTPTQGTALHNYRVEGATSLVDAVWTTRRSVSGVGSSANVTNPVSSDAPAGFYRVVSSSNSAAFVDGEYLVIDLSGGTNATSYPVTSYSGASAVPGGLTNDAYRTDQLLMRRVPKGAFVRGSPTNELGRSGDETQYKVTLTQDFNLGVYEVTQRQWELVMGGRPGYFSNATHYASRPLDRVSYNAIRENPDHTDDPAVNWPTNSEVNAASFMGRLRAKTGLATLDLPTEAQWEYACRAGTTTALDTGCNLTNPDDSDARMNEAGRNYWNGGTGYTQSSDTSNGTAKVGAYLPNAWGFYDMHGNVGEWCLDWYGTYPGPEINPAGAGSGSYRVIRGGSYANTARECRSASRAYNFANISVNRTTGFRVARVLP